MADSDETGPPPAEAEGAGATGSEQSGGEAATVAEGKRGKLERTLGLKETVTIGLGTMLGAGIFVFPGLAVEEAGPAAALSFALGAGDTITGNANADWIIGGYGGDLIHGNDEADTETALDGADVVLGDNGEVLLSSGAVTDIRTYDTSDPLFAADDTITGDAGGDVILGGLGADLIRGDHVLGTDSAQDGADVILGDNGELVWNVDGFDTAVRTFAYTEGSATEAWPANPNGSPGGVAGICDPTGRLFGLMPHPDAFLYPFQHPRAVRGGPLPAEGGGLAIFRNGVDAALE